MSAVEISALILTFVRELPTDMVEHPVLDSELNCPCDDSGNNLRPKHKPRRDLHVVPELHVARER
jgi:hypothetical protein